MSLGKIVTKAVLLHAEDRPMSGVERPGTHQRYCHPKLSVVERDLSDIADGHVRIEMIYAGICGTDLHLISADPQSGYVQSSAPAHIPATGRVIGHEGVGRIVAVGRHVQHRYVGEIVAPESIVSCGHCDVCRRGWFNQCRNARLLGMELDGLFSTYADIPAHLAQPIGSLSNTDDGLRAAAMLEPAGVAYLACENARIGPGDRVVVFGAGPIGLLTAILAKSAFGAACVEIVELQKFRHELAAKFCDRVYYPDEFNTATHKFDALIEASGALDAAMHHFRRLDAHGRLCLLARSGKPLMIDAVDHMITNNVSIVGYRGHLGGVYERLIRLIEAGRLPITRLVTGVVEGISELDTMLAEPDKIVSEHCKVLCRISTSSIV